MTKTYNRFHDPYEDHHEIAQLRELHSAIDRAALDAYGWTDIPADCDFFLDYEIDEATWGRRKKPYRYRWPNAVRDEVLARLLALNAERAAEEARSGEASATSQRAPTPHGGRKRHRQALASHPTLMVAEPKPLWPTPMADLIIQAEEPSASAWTSPAPSVPRRKLPGKPMHHGSERESKYVFEAHAVSQCEVILKRPNKEGDRHGSRPGTLTASSWLLQGSRPACSSHQDHWLTPKVSK